MIQSYSKSRLGSDGIKYLNSKAVPKGGWGAGDLCLFFFFLMLFSNMKHFIAIYVYLFIPGYSSYISKCTGLGKEYKVNTIKNNSSVTTFSLKS